MSVGCLTLQEGKQLVFAAETGDTGVTVIPSAGAGTVPGATVTEGFFADLKVNAYGTDKVIIKGISAENKAKLIGCTWKEKEDGSENELKFRERGEDLILEDCTMSDGEKLILEKKGESLKKSLDRF